MLNYIGGKIRPRHDNVLVRFLPKPKVTSELLVEPKRDYTRTEAVWAEVLETGPGPSYRRCCGQCERPYDTFADAPLKPGDIVVIDSDARGDAMMQDSEELRLVRLAEIAGVVAEL